VDRIDRRWGRSRLLMPPWQFAACVVFLAACAFLLAAFEYHLGHWYLRYRPTPCEQTADRLVDAGVLWEGAELSGPGEFVRACEFTHG
jgi:hypothetical protein